MHIVLYEIGGCVRDELLGVKTKDIDFACEVTGTESMEEAYDFMTKT
jgi:tRNA nucleotidyltransferase/poly(A) polymerase